MGREERKIKRKESYINERSAGTGVRGECGLRTSERREGGHIQHNQI